MIREKNISFYEIKKVFDCTLRADLSLRRICMRLFTLREMCELVGVSRRSIQCYEKAGLMRPKDKNKYGHLLYDEDSLHRATMIKLMQKLGFKLKEIKKIIDAPREVMKEALNRRIEELELENEKLKQIIKDTMEYIDIL